MKKPMISLYESSKDAATQGVNLLPAEFQRSKNGGVNKKPIIKGWQRYCQDVLYNPEDDLASWQRANALAFPQGQQAGFITIDIDTKHDPEKTIDQEFEQLLQHNDPDVFSAAAISITPSGGRHYTWSCPGHTVGNEKLAYHSEGTEAIIETRGVGGQVFCHPTPGYEVIQGFPTEAGEISIDELNSILQLARSLSRKVVEETEDLTPAYTGAPVEGKSPLLDYCEKASVVGILVDQFNFSIVASDKDRVYLLRPGTPTSANSGNVLIEKNLFYCHSSSAGLPTDRPLSAAHLLALHKYGNYHPHDGKRKLRQFLLSQGFGEALPESSFHVESEANNIIEEVGDTLGKIAVFFAQKAANHNDYGNSLAFVEAYGDRVRFISDATIWILWNGKRWVEDPARVGVQRLAHRLISEGIREVASLESEDQRKKTFTHLNRSLNQPKILAMLDAAKSSLALPSSQLDRGDYLLNVQNGILDLKAGKLLPHDPKKYLTKITAVEYDPTSDYTALQAHLDKALPDQLEVHQYLQMILGMGLMKGNSLQEFYIFQGLGGDGKTTLTNSIRMALGDYFAAISTDVLMGRSQNQTAAASSMDRARGARFIVAEESEESFILNDSKMKELTGGGEITAKRYHRDTYTYTPDFIILFLTNKRPHIGTQDRGAWQRIRLLLWEENIRGSSSRKLDHHKAIFEQDGSGILTWLVQGFQAAQEHLQHSASLPLPLRVQGSTIEYREENDLIGPWMDACCSFTDDPIGAYRIYMATDKNLRKTQPQTLLQELVKSYNSWLAHNDSQGKLLSNRRLRRLLEEKGFRSQKTMNGQVIIGISLGK